MHVITLSKEEKNEILFSENELITSNNQRLGNAGEDRDAFLATWLMKDLGADREKGFVLHG